MVSPVAAAKIKKPRQKSATTKMMARVTQIRFSQSIIDETA
jgi:hypothetical protein